MSTAQLALLSAWLLIIGSTHALECGILLNDTAKDITQVIATCLIPTIPVVEAKTENVTAVTNSTHEDDPEEPPAYGPRRALRTRRDARNGTTSTTPKNIASVPVPRATSINTNDTNDPARCVVHCIMSAYSMIGGTGFPELHKVAAGLIRGTPSREMKDFLQDSVDACFQQLAEHADLDACLYSARLATCLADSARFNCSDWPVGELPFPHKF